MLSSVVMTFATDFNTVQLCCLMRILSKEVMTQRRYIQVSIILCAANDEKAINFKTIHVQ
jgi:hypothetical protein